MSYLFNEKNGIRYISFPAFEKAGLAKCVFSTRIGGASKAPYDSLNLGFTTDDKTENVEENRKRFSKIIKNAFQNPILQVHGNNVIAVKKGTVPIRGQYPFLQENNLQCGDAMTTNLPDTPLTILVADCIVVFILDPVKKAIAAIHCGWRGTAQNIIGETLKKMSAEYGTNPLNCFAAISPAIGKCCFIVGKDVYDEFDKKKGTDTFFADKKGVCPLFLRLSPFCGKYSIDLNSINYNLLLKAGVKKENISNCKLCTSCEKNLFYSYRRDKKDTGRMAGVIVLKK